MMETQDSTSWPSDAQRATLTQRRLRTSPKPSILIVSLAILIVALSPVGSGSRSIAAVLDGDQHGNAPQSGPQQEIWGDVDCSGSVNPIDSLKLLRKDAGLSSLSVQGLCPGLGSSVAVNAEERLWGDGDCSGALNPVDSLKTLRYDAGLSAPKVDPTCSDFGDLVTIGAAGGLTLLNEVLFMPGVGDPFVELKTTGGGADPSGLLLVNERDDQFVISNAASIDGEGVLLLEFGGSDFLDDESGFVELRDGGEVLDRVAWGKGEANPVRLSTGGVWGDPEPGMTIGRAPGSTGVGPFGWHPFNPDNATPGLPNVQPPVDALLPFNGAILAPGDVTLTWYPVAGAQTYLVQVADNDAFSPTLIDETVGTPGLEVVLAIGDYFWRVRANGASGASSFSSPQQLSLGPTPATQVAAAPASTTVTLAVPHLKQKKDTAMLLLESDKESGDHGWDRPHTDLDRDDPADNMSCALASLAMMNRFYGGDLSQDRIGYEVFKDRRPGPELDLNWGHGLFYPGQVEQAFAFALGVPSTPFPAIFRSLDQEWAFITAALDADVPLLSTTRTHSTVITGYAAFGGTRLIQIHDPWTEIYWAPLASQGEGPFTNATDSTFIWFWQPAAATNPPDDEPGIDTDSDNDGIVDFDEIQRFHTNPLDEDTDRDGVDEKEDVHESVFGSFGYANFGGLDEDRDWDGDGLPNELDCDSDNDGIKDGEDPDDFSDPDVPVPKEAQCDTLTPRIGDASFTVELCLERADLDPDLIQCLYVFDVSMNYVVSGLPREILCAAKNQGTFVFSAIELDTVELFSMAEAAFLSPTGLAYFDESGNPTFSNPVVVECDLLTPFSEGGSLILDAVEFTFDLPDAPTIDGCFPSNHPDCGLP